MDVDRRLPVLGGAEGLGLAGWDGGVPRDQDGVHPAERLDPERERRDVEEDDLADLAGQHAGLDRRPYGHDLVRVHLLVRLLAGQPPHQFLHARHARGAADQDDLIEVLLGQLRIGQRLLERADAPLHEIGGEFVELRPGEDHIQVLRAGRVRRDERQIDRRLDDGAQLDLGALRRLAQPLQRLPVLA